MRYRFREPWKAGHRSYARGDVIESSDLQDVVLADLLAREMIEEFPGAKELRDRMIHRAPVRK